MRVTILAVLGGTKASPTGSIAGDRNQCFIAAAMTISVRREMNYVSAALMPFLWTWAVQAERSSSEILPKH